jgi:hypothetical protein
MRNHHTAQILTLSYRRLTSGCSILCVRMLHQSLTRSGKLWRTSPVNIRIYFLIDLTIPSRMRRVARIGRQGIHAEFW